VTVWLNASDFGNFDSVEYYVMMPTVDYILLTDSPNGTEIMDMTWNVSDPLLIYASGYNNSFGYIGLVNVAWTDTPDLGDFDNLSATSTTFIGLSEGITQIMGDTGGLSDTFTLDLIIPPPTLDYIVLTDSPNGTEYVTITLSVLDQIAIYASGYNSSSGYLGLVNVSWSQFPVLGSFNNLSGNSTIFSAGLIGGSTIISGENNTSGLSDSFTIDIIPPTIDYIQIRDEPNGTGDVVLTRTYIVWQTDWFYAAGYNHTIGYIQDVDAFWSSNDTAVGTVTSPGPKTTFSVQEVPTDSTCHISADYNGTQNSTGAFLVLAPTIDYITIVDSLDGSGSWIGGRTYNEGDKDTFWAASYNLTSDYIRNVKATWECNDTIVGIVSKGSNEFANFTAGWRGGYCRVTATYNSFTNITGDIFVINFNQLPTSSAGSYNETGFTGGNFSFLIDITLRVTGRKENIITMDLEEDGHAVKSVAVTRHSGQPDIGVISHEMDVHSTYEVVLRYDGHNGGSNPLLVTFDFLDNIYSVHLLFNSQHGMNQTARIKFNDILQLVGVVFFDGFYSTDFEGYLVNYQWNFGDGEGGAGETLAHTYQENGIYTVTLTVTDDEGGTDTDTLTVYVNNIDNNDQVNAILGSNASQGYLNGSGQYVVILECPADSLIKNIFGQQSGLLNSSIINEINGAFLAKLYSDIEVYFIPLDELYTILVDGMGYGSYNLSVIGISNDHLKKYGFYDVTCSPDTHDLYSFDFNEEYISISTEEDKKYYSVEIIGSSDEGLDTFDLRNMRLDKNATHAYRINDWNSLSSEKPVTLSIDEDSDGVSEKNVDLPSGLTGADVDKLPLRHPISEPVVPLLFFVLIGVVVSIGAIGLLTEVGKWVVLSIFIALYSRIKKENILDQPIRYKIHGYVIGNPGAHFGLIKQDLELGTGQVVYHLKRLAEADLIYSKEDGIKKRFYPMDYTISEIDGYHFNKTEEKIIDLIKETSGITQKKIASSIGISRQVAGYHLSKMEDIGIIEKKPEGRNVKYYSLKDTTS
jgi:predicted transcriptional regulator